MHVFWKLTKSKNNRIASTFAEILKQLQILVLKQFLLGVKNFENWCSAHETRNNSRGTRQSDILNDATLFQNVCHMRLNATFQEQTILNWETDDFGSITILNFFLSWHGSLRPWLQQVKGEASGWDSKCAWKNLAKLFKEYYS